MSTYKKQQQVAKTLGLKWLPVIITAIVIIKVPPAAIAVILAYFTAPLLLSVQSVLKLPLTIATLLVMIFNLFLISSFIYIGIHGILEIIPAVERHLTPFSNETDIIGKTFTLVEVKIIEYSSVLVEHTVTIISTIFQHVISLFIFLIAYFFALRECGKDRFWFLVYFPTKLRKQTKNFFTASSQLIVTFVSVEARLIFVTFVLLAVGFSLLRFNSPIGIAFLISLVDSFPFLGIGLFIIPMAIYFFHAGNFFLGSSLIFLYLLTLIIRQVAESYMYASTFQIKPIHAFFIVACSVYLFGIVGVLLTPFLLFAALKIKQHPLFT